MARMKCFDEGQDLIVVIMLEPVEPHKMTETLRALIKRVTYIEWPQDPDGRDQFWQNPEKVLRAPHAGPMKCECGRYVINQQSPSSS